MIGVDPGKVSPAHCAIECGGRPLFVSRTPLLGLVAQPVVIAKPVVQERKGVKVSRQSLLTLGLYTGLHGGAYLGLPGFEVFLGNEPKIRDVVFPTSGYVPKTVWQARLKMRYPEQCRAVAALAKAAKVKLSDALDAWGIAYGGQILYDQESAFLWKVKL